MPDLQSRSALTALIVLLFPTCLQLLAPFARAEAPASYKAAPDISGADGTVRTQAGVKLLVAAVSSLNESELEQAKTALSLRMSRVRGCFAAAMARSPLLDGSLQFEVRARPQGRTTAKLQHADPKDDAKLIACMGEALASANFVGVPRGTRLTATLTIDNPVVKFRSQQAQRSTLADVHVSRNGQAESHGGTVDNEVGYRVAGAADAGETVGALHQQLLDHLSGLLDCRRKASRKTRSAEGSLSLGLSINDGRIVRVRTVENSMNDRRAPPCIAAWLGRVDASQLASTELDITVRFAR